MADSLLPLYFNCSFFVFSIDAIVVTSTGPIFDIAFKPNRPLFCPEKVTNWVAGRDKEIFPASTFWTISSSSPSYEIRILFSQSKSRSESLSILTVIRSPIFPSILTACFWSNSRCVFCVSRKLERTSS